jgi:hypothetical protein
MASSRRTASLVVGGIQCGVGGVATVFAYLIYASQQIRDAFAIASGEIYLYMFILLVFAAFSLISGLLFVQEEDSRS